MKIIKWSKKEKPNLELLKRELEKENLEYYLFSSGLGDFYDWHGHDHDEIRIVVSGSMKFGVKDKEIILNGGDRLELPKHTKHWAEVAGSKRCIMLSASRK